MSWTRVAVPSDDLLSISVVTDDDTGCYLDDIGEPGCGVTMKCYEWLKRDGFREKLAAHLEQMAADIRAKKGQFKEDLGEIVPLEG